MSYVDTPDKKQKHPHYEHRTSKLFSKNNEFSSKKFHQIRQDSTHKNLIKSFGRIGMCLNDQSTIRIGIEDLDRVCYILINNYEDEQNDLGVGPLNDGYLIGLNHRRLGFKIFYLYNPSKEKYMEFLEFFLKNTKVALTVFYTGRDLRACGIEGIEFINGSLLKKSISQIISENCTGKPRVVFITDCFGGGSVFDISPCVSDKSGKMCNMISFYVEKENSKEIKEMLRFHGIFTFYFCKIISEYPNITLSLIADKINISLNRFKKVLRYDLSNIELENCQIYFN